jgi:hypothetical protein
MDTSQTTAGKTTMIVLQFILPVILAIIAGYGSVKYSSGETQQRLANDEAKIEEMRKQLEYMRSNSISREEMKIFMDGQSETLRTIQTDIREIRNRR